MIKAKKNCHLVFAVDFMGQSRGVRRLYKADTINCYKTDHREQKVKKGTFHCL